MVGLARISILTLVIWGLVALTAWSVYTPPQSGKVVGVARHGSDTEFVPPPDLKADLAVLTKADIWGARAAPANQAANSGSAKPQAEVWSRVAIVKEAAGAFILLSSPSGEVKPFKAGDTLPDGSKLLRISTSEIVVKPTSSRSQVIHLLN